MDNWNKNSKIFLKADLFFKALGLCGWAKTEKSFIVKKSSQRYVTNITILILGIVLIIITATAHKKQQFKSWNYGSGDFRYILLILQH